MSENTKIEWADHTFNPWIGCTKVSPACDHCYAERLAQRMQVTWGAGEARRRTKPRNWAEPLKWDRQAEGEGVRYRVFCASLADVFDNEVPIEWRVDLFDLIRRTPNLDWLLLTKRIGNVSQMLNTAADYACMNAASGDLMRWIERWADGDHLPTNVWLGATVVTQAEADRDVPKLLRTPAHIRFLSIEPMLGAIDLTQIDDGSAHREVPREEWGSADDDDSPPSLWWDALTGERTIMHGGGHGDWSRTDASLDWIIAGGESGPHARPSHPDWFRSLRDQCFGAGAPYLFKQWGEWHPLGQAMADGCINAKGSPRSWHQFDDGEAVENVGKVPAGRILDGRTWDEAPT